MAAGDHREPVLVGDIGGTHGRLGVACFGAGETVPRIDRMRIYMSADYRGLGAMLKAFLGELGGEAPRVARLAVAGPVSRRAGHLTNLGWTVDAGALEADLGLEDIGFLNDFEALAHAATVLRNQDVVCLKEGDRQAAPGLSGAMGPTGVRGLGGAMGPISVMGPGTGFGVALAVPCGRRWRVVASEGGHMTFAPSTELEYDLARFLGRDGGHVSVEHVLCGEGLVRIHRFLAHRDGVKPAARRAAEISARALADPESRWHRAARLFLAMLGSAAGDIALAHGATGGVCFGGGVLPKIAGLIGGSELARRFAEKGLMSGFLRRIPITMILSPDAALVGAAIAEARDAEAP